MAWQAPFRRTTKDWRERVFPWVAFIVVAALGVLAAGLVVVIRARVGLR